MITCPACCANSRIESTKTLRLTTSKSWKAPRHTVRHRRRQGYSIPLIVEESRVLYEIIADTMQSNLADMDTSSIVPDMIPIGDNLYVMLVQSLRAVVSAEPAAA